MVKINIKTQFIESPSKNLGIKKESANKKHHDIPRIIASLPSSNHHQLRSRSSEDFSISLGSGLVIYDLQIHGASAIQEEFTNNEHYHPPLQRNSQKSESTEDCEMILIADNKTPENHHSRAPMERCAKGISQRFKKSIKRL